MRRPPKLSCACGVPYFGQDARYGLYAHRVCRACNSTDLLFSLSAADPSTVYGLCRSNSSGIAFMHSPGLSNTKGGDGTVYLRSVTRMGWSNTTRVQSVGALTMQATPKKNQCAGVMCIPSSSNQGGVLSRRAVQGQ